MFFQIEQTVFTQGDGIYEPQMLQLVCLFMYQKLQLRIDTFIDIKVGFDVFVRNSENYSRPDRNDIPQRWALPVIVHGREKPHVGQGDRQDRILVLIRIIALCT
jgi:hypothetical protein